MKEFLRNLGWPAVCGLLLALLIMQQFPHWLGFPANSAAIPAALALPSSSGGVVSYSEAVAKAAPAVANIFTTKQIPSRDNAPFGDSTLRDYADTLDRKSTRLNSSHVKSSYAVFCVKKK